MTQSPPASATGGPTPGDHRELEDALAQTAATQEILAALGRAGSDPGIVLDTIVDRAARLCRAQVAQVYLVEGDHFRLSRVAGAMSGQFRAYLMEHPLAMSRASLGGRVAEDRRAQQIPDVLADPSYGRHDLQQIAGYRTLLAAPMLLDDDVVGVLSVWRTHVQPFSERETTMLTGFAVQAAIVLRQVHLVRDLEARRTELASKVAALEALREVSDAVSSSLDIDEVLAQVVANAVHLTAADGGSIMEYDEATGRFSVRTAQGGSPRMLERLRSLDIPGQETLIGSGALSHRPVTIPDLAAVPVDAHLKVLRDDGWRSVLAVPMLRQEQLVGALVIRSRSPGPFAAETVELLQTFASQSALAILNARLFGELASKGAELEVASRHKSEFLASMSHELRTPLNAVIGFSEVLLDRMFGELNDRQEEYLRDIWNSGRHLLELLNEILDLSKVEAGHMTLEPRWFSVASAVEYAVSLVRERATRHGLTLEVDVAPDVGSVQSDELRFKQVLLNLVSNAVKFTPDGGRVSVGVRRHQHELLVTVTDTGVGVAPEDRERIFESFQQGPRGAPKEEGTGLGLTLSRRIVELFDGRLWMDSRPGRGSTFGFALPVYPREPATAEDDAVDRPLVVLVDDDRASRELMSAYLATRPVRVAHARDGEEALSMIRQLTPAAVVLDIRLPRRDGWQVLADLRADRRTEAIPVVVTSIVDDAPRGLALGASAYLLKPVGRDELLAALDATGALPGPARTGGDC